METPLCIMSKSETTSDSNWKVLREGEVGRRGALGKVTSTLDQFLIFNELTMYAYFNCIVILFFSVERATSMEILPKKPL